MKKRNLFVTLGLALALALGVGVRFGAKQEYREAKATTYSAIGNFVDDWGTDFDMTDANDDGVFETGSISISAGTNYFFKVRYDHAWTTSYGGANVFYKPTTTNNSVWTKDGGTDAGFWSETAINVKICFRPSDQMIAIVPASYSFPTSFFTFYLNQNTSWSDWSSPRINYWTSNMGVIWNKSPSLSNLSTTYSNHDVTGNLYSISIPSDTTGLLIAKSDLSAQTQNLAISSGDINVAHFWYDESVDTNNHLYGYYVKESATGAYLRGDWTNGWSAVGQIAMSGSQGGPYSATGVNLSADSAVKAVYITHGIVESWCEFANITGNPSTNDADHYPVKKISDGIAGYNAGVVSTGTYNITVTYSEPNTAWLYAFTGTANVDLEEAVAYANAFVTAMYANCPYNHSTGSYNDGKSSSTVASAWSAQIAAYTNDVSEDAKVYLEVATSNITAISNFFDCYDYVYGHYATVRAIEGADFLGRTPETVASYTSQGIAETTVSSNTALIIVIAVSSIALLAIAGYFMLRRRKED